MSEVQQKLYSAKETVALLGVSRATLSRLLQKNAIGHFRVGTRTMFSSHHISKFLESVEQQPKEPHRAKGAGRG